MAHVWQHVWQHVWEHVWVGQAQCGFLPFGLVFDGCARLVVCRRHTEQQPAHRHGLHGRGVGNPRYDRAKAGLNHEGGEEVPAGGVGAASVIGQSVVDV